MLSSFCILSLAGERKRENDLCVNGTLIILATFLRQREILMESVGWVGGVV